MSAFLSRRLPSLSVLLLAALLDLASCRSRHDWIMFRGQQGRGATPNAIKPPLGIKWKLRLQATEKPTYAFNNAVVKDGTIYFGSTDGNFYALDIESGYMRWVFKTNGAINSVPFADEEKVYFGSNNGKVYAVSREDASEIWSFQTDSTVQSTIIRYEDIIIFASDGGTAYFLSPEGEEYFTMPNPVWHYNTFQVYRDAVYFAPGPPNRPHSLGAFDLGQRAYLWVMETANMEATWYSFPALEGDLLFFSTAGYRGEYWLFNYYALKRETGEIVWRYTDESDWGRLVDVPSREMFASNMKLLDYLAPSLWKNLVIYTSGDTVVRAFRARSGRLAWRRQFDTPTSSAPTVAGDRVYFGLQGEASLYGEGAAGSGSMDEGARGGQEGRLVRDSGMSPPRLVCLSARDGRLLWEMELEGALLSAPVIAGRWIVFGTDRNFFYVLEELY